MTAWQATILIGATLIVADIVLTYFQNRADERRLVRLEQLAEEVERL